MARLAYFCFCFTVRVNKQVRLKFAVTMKMVYLPIEYARYQEMDPAVSTRRAHDIDRRSHLPRMIIKIKRYGKDQLRRFLNAPAVMNVAPSFCKRVEILRCDTNNKTRYYNVKGRSPTFGCCQYHCIFYKPKRVAEESQKRDAPRYRDGRHLHERNVKFWENRDGISSVNLQI